MTTSEPDDPRDVVGVVLGHCLGVPLIAGLMPGAVCLAVGRCHGSSCTSSPRVLALRAPRAVAPMAIGGRSAGEFQGGPCQHVGQQVVETLTSTLRGMVWTEPAPREGSGQQRGVQLGDRWTGDVLDEPARGSDGGRGPVPGSGSSGVNGLLPGDAGPIDRPGGV